MMKEASEKRQKEHKDRETEFCRKYCNDSCNSCLLYRRKKKSEVFIMEEKPTERKIGHGEWKCGFNGCCAILNNTNKAQHFQDTHDIIDMSILVRENNAYRLKVKTGRPRSENNPACIFCGGRSNKIGHYKDEQKYICTECKKSFKANSFVFITPNNKEEETEKVIPIEEETEETIEETINNSDKIDMVNNPPHYNQGTIQPIDFIEDHKLDFHLGNIVKYIVRAKHKGDELENLLKAEYYLHRRIKELKIKQEG